MCNIDFIVMVGIYPDYMQEQAYIIILYVKQKQPGAVEKSSGQAK